MGMALAIAGMGLNLLGGMSQAAGARAQGTAQAESYGYQAMIARNNAQMAQRNAQWTSEQGEVGSTVEGMKTGAQVASMKAAQAAGGVDVNTGSAVSVRDAALRLGAINALTIKSNKAREAWGYQVDKTNEEMQATLDERAGKYAKQAGEMGYGSTLLSTAGSVVGQWQKYQSTVPGSSYPSMGA